MEPLNRREFIAMTAVTPLLQAPLHAATEPAAIFPCIHEASSELFDFKTAMEGYSKAGIRAAEITLVKVREFAQKESVAAARRLLGDLGLRAASSSNQLGLTEPTEQRAKSLEELKWKVELAQAMGADRIVAPCLGAGPYTDDDFKRGSDNLREAGEIAKPFGVSVMLEFTRMSTLAGSLPSALRIVRGADHPNVRVMIDTYHFWGGISKFEDLELLRDGELHHIHFEGRARGSAARDPGPPAPRLPRRGDRTAAAHHRVPQAKEVHGRGVSGAVPR